MNKTIIEIKGVGKKYNITHQRGKYVALRDVLADILRSPLKFAKTKAKQVTGFETKEEFWALKGVSFEVRRGEVVGVIGRNGAGKSTLLKILTGITPPTEGEIVMRGRVASLLEVGTGFHPELTGRENIFLNGAILGMTKKEIVHKFDEIVAFSGVEKFLDTPVKYYSSGMYVRLAFSVAAHMEPDILLVDEVLAVGDAEFQKKCLGKMEEVTKQDGRTILFVSHNLAAVESLCQRSILLLDGKVVMEGKTAEVIDYYKSLSSATGPIDVRMLTNRRGNGSVRLTRFHLENKNGDEITSVENGEDVVLVFSYESNNPESIHLLDLGFSLHKKNIALGVFYSSFTNESLTKINKTGQIKFAIHDIPLSEGHYEIGARIIANGTEADWPKDMVGSIDVKETKKRQAGFTIHPESLVVLNGTWLQSK